MAKYRYTGSDERTIPGLGVVVRPGEEFDAPDGFSAFNVERAESAPKVKQSAPIVGDKEDAQ